jgi:type VI secretion system protein ImpL
VSDELFHQQDDQINFQIMIYPLPTPGVDEISLIVNGNTYRYRNEPQQWQQFNWTMQNKNDETILKIITAKDKSPLIIEINSLWGIFQLLRRAEITKESNDIYRVTWKFHNDEGNAYKISLLFKWVNQPELYREIVSGTFEVTNRIFLIQ